MSAFRVMRVHRGFLHFGKANHGGMPNVNHSCFRPLHISALIIMQKWNSASRNGMKLKKTRRETCVCVFIFLFFWRGQHFLKGSRVAFHRKVAPVVFDRRCTQKQPQLWREVIDKPNAVGTLRGRERGTQSKSEDKEREKRGREEEEKKKTGERILRRGQNEEKTSETALSRDADMKDSRCFPSESCYELNSSSHARRGRSDAGPADDEPDCSFLN